MKEREVSRTRSTFVCSCGAQHELTLSVLEEGNALWGGTQTTRVNVIEVKKGDSGGS